MNLIFYFFKIVHSAFYKEKDLTLKSSFADLVTESDQLVEKTLIGYLKDRYPSHHFIGEESGVEKQTFDDRPTWIIDPIDGTTNFVHKYPYCSISVGFYHKKEVRSFR